MRQSRIRIIFDGALAGMAGAVIIALWFLLFDLADGRPLGTPALLASTLFPQLKVLHQGVGFLAAEYTVFHLCAFALVGIGGALILEAAEYNAALFPTLFIFVVAFEVFFAAIIMMLGPAASAALPWWKVLAGNLMATGVMLAVFFWRQKELAHNLLGPWLEVARQGFVAGIAGAVVLAVWFFLCDLATHRMLYTPALLGAVVFKGPVAQAGFNLSVPLVLGYTFLHFFGFIAFGLAASVLMAASEYEPLFSLSVLVLFVCFEVSFLGFITYLDGAAATAIGWWKIVVGNLLALAAMVEYFLRGHPRILRRFSMRWSALELEVLGRRPRTGAHSRPGSRAS
jgi:hypothetical protein